MEHADFVHLARTSELACAENSRAYRRSVMWFAALGYAWVLGCVVLAVALLAWSVPHLLAGRFRFLWIMLVLTGLGLLIASLRALWVRFEEPEAVLLKPQDAPALFDALERIRSRIKGPPIHEVYLDDQFNAGVRQIARWGPLGGHVNQLIIGLPLLLAVDKRRLLAVLAHEYGHLRGDHNRFSSWIYRTRLSWGRLYESMQDSANPIAVMTQAFLRWYSPRFVARSFALARQDEYEADRVAAKLLGKAEVVDSLVEIEIKHEWFANDFWLQHWTRAADQATPLAPYSAMQRLLTLPPEPQFAKQAFHGAVQRVSSVDDTHPVLRERVAALTGERPRLPQKWSSRGSLSLLGKRGAHWLAHFDKLWCEDNAGEWTRLHARLGRSRERLGVLKAREVSLGLGEMVEMANLTVCLQPGAPVSAIYQQVLERDPLHADALIGVAQALTNEDPERSLQYLERLWSNHPAHRLWASRAALAELETPREGREYDAAALKLWRERVRSDERAEEEVSEELNRRGILETVLPHDMSDFDLVDLQAELARQPRVARAWLLRKPLHCMPDRRVHLLLVAMKQGVDDTTAFEVCNDLELRLALPGMTWILRADLVASDDQLALLSPGPVFVRARL